MEGRSGVYRAATRAEAERAYHEDARIAAGEGYVPTSEDWTTALGQQVLTVGYVHAPDQAPAVLEGLAAVEAAPPAAEPTATPLAPAAAPAPAVAAKPGNGGRNALIALVVIALIAVVAWQTGLLARFTSAGGSAGNIPPTGQVWFGSSFDPQTFALSGITSTGHVGSTAALVAHLTKSISSGQANLRLSLNGTVVANQALSVTGSGELFGSTVGPYVLPGTFLYEIVDIGGNVLASGSITVVSP